MYDRRLGRVSARRADADEVAQILELFDTRDFNAEHFHEKPAACHGVRRSYVRLTLQAHGRPRAAPRRALHQDGSRREWVSGRQWASPWTTPPASRPSSSPRKAPIPGASRGGRRVRAVPLALPRQPLFSHARGRRQGGQGQPDPGRARPSPARRTSPPARPRPAGAVRRPAEAPAPGTQARRRHGRGQPFPQAGLPAGPQRKRSINSVRTSSKCS